MITRSEYLGWMENPVTQELIKHINKNIQDQMDFLISSVSLNVNETATQYSLYRGQLGSFVELLSSVKKGSFIEDIEEEK